MNDDTFWSMLCTADRDMLTAAGRSHYHPKGTPLLREGDSPGSAWVLEAGRAKIVAVAPGGHKTILGIRRPGDLIGELSAIDGQSRAATATAIDGITALRIPRGAFTEFLRTNSAICHAVLTVVAFRLRAASRFRAEFTSTTVAERLIRQLAQLADQYGQERANGIAITLPFSQEELASTIAASREAVVRALKPLRDARIVDTTRQQIVILRPDELHHLAGDGL